MAGHNDQPTCDRIPAELKCTPAEMYSLGKIVVTHEGSWRRPRNAARTPLVDLDETEATRIRQFDSLVA